MTSDVLLATSGHGRPTADRATRLHARPCRRACSQRGVSLVESLVALVIAGAGMLAWAAFQAQLDRDAHLARQRTDATRLAHDQLEALRAYSTIAPIAGSASYADIVDGEDAVETPGDTRYERRWTVSAPDGDAYRLVSVDVTWNDRAGDEEAARVKLAAIVARIEPSDSGAVAMPDVESDGIRRAHGRHRSIPAEAVALRTTVGRRSALQWHGTRPGYLVFDDTSGEIAALCATRPADGIDLATQCMALAAVLLQGHVVDVPPGASIGLVFDRLEHLAAGTSPDCVVAALPTPADDGAITWRYRCLVEPGDHDGDPATPRIWSGRVRLLGVPPGLLSCRMADPTTGIARPETYTAVDRSLDHQNFLLTAAGVCPGGSMFHPPA